MLEQFRPLFVTQILYFFDVTKKKKLRYNKAPKNTTLMIIIAVFKTSEQAVQLSKKITSKGFLAYVATRKGSSNGLNFKLMVSEEDREAVRALLME